MLDTTGALDDSGVAQRLIAERRTRALGAISARIYA
tara:strand:- start:4818 stop:4925 length:108 start_codon:yes stop_codon:yes gene_type:complete